MGIYGGFMGFIGSNGIYPLLNVYRTMESHNLYWEHWLFLWSFSIARLNYQMVFPASLDINTKATLSSGWCMAKMQKKQTMSRDVGIVWYLMIFALWHILILVGGWPTPLKKYEFVNWDNYSQDVEIHKTCSSHHQQVSITMSTIFRHS